MEVRNAFLRGALFHWMMNCLTLRTLCLSLGCQANMLYLEGVGFRIQTALEPSPDPLPVPGRSPAPSASDGHGSDIKSLKKQDLLSWGLEFW